MPYYQAGDYYRGGYAAGDNYGAYQAGGIFGFIGKAAKAVGGAVLKVGGAVAKTVIGATPLGAAITAIAPPTQTLAGPSGPIQMVPTPGVTGAVQRLVPGGASGYQLKKRRHMNAGNAKAARRAISRIKSVRHLLQSIERELPRRPAPRGGSRGVITRAEAARALRS
jgi:hypothetical protein